MTLGCRAAVEVVGEFGFIVEQPVLIQETNNTVIWLRPHPIIAKVATRSDSAEMLKREHRVASTLQVLGAEVGPPIPGISPLRHPETGFVVTLWERLDHDPSRHWPAPLVGESLRRLHRALAVCEVELPGFRLGLQRARRALCDDRLIGALGPPDRAFLRSAFDSLLAELDHCAFREQALHGEPHDGNYLLTTAGLRWIDFESACRGPLEWDLAFLAEDAMAAFPDIDPGLLELLRTLNSARVATWCWVRYDFPEMRWRARHHLQIVKERWRAGT